MQPRRIVPPPLVLLALFIFIFPLLAAGSLYLWVRDDIPSPENILTQQPSLATFVYDAEGKLVGTFAAERRRLVPLSAVSEDMRKAVVAVEDERFYRHKGVDPVGILRAAYSNLRAGTISQGASTLTQQLVRHLVLGREKTFKRKLIEAIAAVKLEMTLTKDEILERYLNLVYFGRGAYGVAAAARTYFDKEPSDLTTAESALLAGLVQAPGRFRPFVDPGPSLERRTHVLERMVAARHLSKEEAERVAKSPLGLRQPTPIMVGGHFIEFVRRRLEETYGSTRLYRGGLRVYTTLRLDEQRAAETAVRKGVERLIKKRWSDQANMRGWQPPEASLLAIEPSTGATHAMVGGVNFKRSKFNRAVQALRQPGSAFKPIVYAAAIDMGFTPTDSVLDAPIVMESGAGRPAWKPQNYAKNFSGRLSLRDALAESRNTVSVRLANLMGMNRLVAFSKLLGIRSPITPNLASALGSSVVTLKELVAAYGVFANGGYYVEPYAIERIEEADGTVLHRHEAKPVAAIRPEVAYVITHMLKGVVERGTGRGAAVLGRPIAGKTGTTNDYRDNWFIGYSPKLMAGVWVGFDLPRSLGYGESGGRNALPIFVDFFEDALKGKPVEDFVPPQGVEFVRIDRETGFLAARESKKVGFEAFLQGTAPTKYSESDEKQSGAIFRSDVNRRYGGRAISR